MEPSIAARNKKPDLPGGCARGARSFVNAAGCGQDHTRRRRALTRSRSPMRDISQVTSQWRAALHVHVRPSSSAGARAAKVAARTHRHRPRCPFLLLNGAAFGINTLRACLSPTSLYLWRADYYLIGKAKHRP